MSRVYKHRGAYHIDYLDVDGKRHRVRVGGSRKVAEEMLTAAEDKRNRGELGRFEQSSISFADAAGRWLDSLRPDLKPRTLLKWRWIVARRLKPAFRGQLRAVNADTIGAYIKAQSDQGAAPATINSTLAVLRLIMAYAIEKLWLSYNPFRDRHGNPVKALRRLREPSGRVRYLSDEELSRLLATVEHDPYLRAFVLVGLNTGLRRDEVLSLSHTTVDLTNRLARLGNTKSGRDRVVYLNEVAISALTGLPHRLDGKFFPYSNGNVVTMKFRRAANRAGLADFRLHDMRHHFASMQAMAGVAGKALSDLLGHANTTMTSRYTHLSADYLRAAVDRLQIGGKARG